MSSLYEEVKCAFCGAALSTAGLCPNQYQHTRQRLDAEAATARVLVEVRAERKRQELKWGEQNHAPPTYLTILGEEFGEACQAALNITSPGEKGMETAALAEAALRKELVQVAAVAVAAIECLDRAKWKQQ